MNDHSKEYSDLMQGLVGPHVSPVRARALIAGYAYRLAGLQRLRVEELDLTGQKARIVGRIIDMIDPEVKP